MTERGNDDVRWDYLCDDTESNEGDGMDDRKESEEDR